MPVKFADVDNEYVKNKELKRDDVRILQEWISKQPHLPKISEMKLILFLHSCYYRIEAAKVSIEKYYTIRTHCPEFFSKRNVNSKEVQQQLNITLIARLPIYTKEGYNVTFQKIVNSNADLYIYNDQVKVLDMIESLVLMQTGTTAGDVIIFDMVGAVFGHFAKVNIASMRKYMFFLQEALPVRVKGIHFINVTPLTDKMMTLVKPFLKKEMIETLHLHQTLDTLYKFVPKEALPAEYGGAAGTIKEMHQQVIKNFVENAKYFEEEERNDMVNEAKRQGKPSDINKIFGVEGTFKKLEID